MRELAGGSWLAALLAAAMGLYVGAGVLFLVGAAAGAASWYDEQLEERRAASWRKQYPPYGY